MKGDFMLQVYPETSTETQHLLERWEKETLVLAFHQMLLDFLHHQQHKAGHPNLSTFLQHHNLPATVVLRLNGGHSVLRTHVPELAQVLQLPAVVVEELASLSTNTLSHPLTRIQHRLTFQPTPQGGLHAAGSSFNPHRHP